MSDLDLMEGVVLQTEEQLEHFKNARSMVRKDYSDKDMSNQEVIEILSRAYTGCL